MARIDERWYDRPMIMLIWGASSALAITGIAAIIWALDRL